MARLIIAFLPVVRSQHSADFLGRYVQDQLGQKCVVHDRPCEEGVDCCGVCAYIGADTWRCMACTEAGQECIPMGNRCCDGGSRQADAVVAHAQHSCEATAETSEKYGTTKYTCQLAKSADTYAELVSNISALPHAAMSASDTAPIAAQAQLRPSCWVSNGEICEQVFGQSEGCHLTAAACIAGTGKKIGCFEYDGAACTWKVGALPGDCYMSKQVCEESHPPPLQGCWSSNGSICQYVVGQSEGCHPTAGSCCAATGKEAGCYEHDGFTCAWHVGDPPSKCYETIDRCQGANR